MPVALQGGEDTWEQLVVSAVKFAEEQVSLLEVVEGRAGEGAGQKWYGGGAQNVLKRAGGTQVAHEDAH